mgnify:FL=1
MSTEEKKVTWEHPINVTREEGAPKSVRMQRVFDVQWSDCPLDVEENVKELWHERELYNDKYIAKFSHDDWDDPRWELIVGWLLLNDVERGETVWIHWWW